jgi:hypothetical protein
VTDAADETPSRYGRVLVIWVLVLGALYAFQQYFT